MSSLDSLTDIYIITNLLNGDAYVGQAVQYKRGGQNHGTRGRFHDHVSEALNCGTTGCWHLNAAIRKYGADMFKPRTLRVVASAEADYWETSWYIAEYNTFKGRGYNLTAGGKCAGQLMHGAYGPVITAEMPLNMCAAGKTYMTVHFPCTSPRGITSMVTPRGVCRYVTHLLKPTFTLLAYSAEQVAYKSLGSLLHMTIYQP